jgi:uncharacterized repeat protein (TIGR02543 family)
MKKQAVIFVVTIFCLTFFGCEAMADLFHGPKAEEPEPLPITHTVTFDANGATNETAPPAQTVVKGSDITLPNEGELSVDGNSFGGWNTNAAGTGTNYPASSRYTVNGDVTLYAKWNAVPPKYRTVTFYTDGGSGVPAQTVTSGGTATLPPDPTKNGYTFGNWYGDEGLTELYNFSAPVTGNITLFAKWIMIPFTSITDIASYLATLPANTAATPYALVVNISSLGGSYNTNGSLGYVLRANNTKYVNLDLSGSTFTSITENAFFYCRSLTSITIGKSVTSIEYNVFYNCTSLTGIIIPESVTSIEGGAFMYCTSLTGIIIPNSVTSIGDLAFMYCTSLTGIIIPNSVTSIGVRAFINCTSLTSVEFKGTIPLSGFIGYPPFHGDLRDKFYATDSANGTPGTYTTSAPVGDSSVWTRQPQGGQNGNTMVTATIFALALMK